MKEIFTSNWFQIIGVTFVSSILGIFVKYVSRNDAYNKSFKKEDLAIGLEMVITALILLITNSVNQFNKLSDSSLNENVKNIIRSNEQIVPWIILILIIGLWGTSTVIRKIGWENEDELKISWGIVFPNIIGIASLIYVFTWIR